MKQNHLVIMMVALFVCGCSSGDYPEIKKGEDIWLGIIGEPNSHNGFLDNINEKGVTILTRGGGNTQWYKETIPWPAIKTISKIKPPSEQIEIVDSIRNYPSSPAINPPPLARGHGRLIFLQKTLDGQNNVEMKGLLTLYDAGVFYEDTAFEEGFSHVDFFPWHEIKRIEGPAPKGLNQIRINLLREKQNNSQRKKTEEKEK